VTFVRDEPVEATLQVVRYFNDPDGDEDNAASTETDELDTLEWATSTSRLDLDLAVLNFLQSTSADLDVDEYG